VCLGVALLFCGCSGGGSPGVDGGNPDAGVGPNDSGSTDDLVLQFVGRDAGPFFIDQDAGTILAVLVINGDVDIQHFFVTPDITLSPGAAIAPASGVSEDLNSPVHYTVTAGNGSTQREYVAQVLDYNFPDSNPTTTSGIPSGNTTPRPPGSTLYTTLDASLVGTWSFHYSAALEIRTVGSDTVYTLLEESPTSQTTTVKVNDTLQSPTTAAGHFGYSASFNADHSYAGSDDLGDTSTGSWKFLDLGANAIHRYAIDIAATTTIPGGPTASGTERWYINGVYAHALFLTQDPMMTSSSITTFETTLVR
jgi:hypothetical protein